MLYRNTKSGAIVSVETPVCGNWEPVVKQAPVIVEQPEPVKKKAPAKKRTAKKPKG